MVVVVVSRPPIHSPCQVLIGCIGCVVENMEDQWPAKCSSSNVHAVDLTQQGVVPRIESASRNSGDSCENSCSDGNGYAG